MQFSHAFLAAARSMVNLKVQEPGAFSFTLRGELTARDMTGIKATVEEALLSGVRHFIVDLGDVEHINRTALQVFADAISRIHRYNAEVALVSPSPYITMLIRSAGIVDMPRSFPSADDVLRAWDATITGRLAIGR
ncbi:MAG: STAS domain-containing protein [Nitrospirota bacterium]|nr:STAS domain-containing protein [Nitrospirota bacterium]